MASTTVSNYSAENMRYYRKYFQDDQENILGSDRDSDNETEVDKDVKKSEKLPRIILRNNLGKELNTFTTLQEAIYRAKRNVQQSMQAVKPEEWRLPHAPLPSKPDFSRAVPTISEYRKRLKAKKQRLTKSTPNGPYDVDIDVDDVGFVAESLQHLPQVPSLSFLRQELLAEPKKYFPFVRSMLLFKKFISQTDKRDHVYHFPGFCSGCRRLGLCYGCEKSLEPHYHEDQPVKTGGGFTYYKHDRPEHELKHRHPSNWRFRFPELARRGADFEAWKEKEMLENVQEISDFEENKKKGFLPPIIPEFGSRLTGVNADISGETTTESLQNKDNFSEEDEGILVDRLTAEEEELLGIKRSKPSSRSTKFSGLEGDDEMYSVETGSEMTSETTLFKGKRVSIVEDLRKINGETVENREGYWDQSTDSDDNEERGSSHRRKSRRKRRLGHSRDRQSGTEEEDDGRSHSNLKSALSGSSTERKRLYKAPPPFKIKKRPNRKTQSLSPFSTDRKYNIPKGDGFKVKKSGKSPTQIKEFVRHEGDWKAPKKFEIKRTDKKQTRFWSPPPQKEKPKKVFIVHINLQKQMKRRELPKTVERLMSPDSGLESEKMIGFRKGHMSSYQLLCDSNKMPSWDNDVPTSLDNNLPSISEDKADSVHEERKISVKEGNSDEKIFNNMTTCSKKTTSCDSMSLLSRETTLTTPVDHPVVADHVTYDNGMTLTFEVDDLDLSDDEIPWYIEDKQMNKAKDFMKENLKTDADGRSEQIRSFIKGQRSWSERSNGKEESQHETGHRLKYKREKKEEKVFNFIGKPDGTLKKNSHSKIFQTSVKTKTVRKTGVKDQDKFKGYKVKKHTDEKENYEIDFDKLPSIKETLAKILPKKIVVDLNSEMTEKDQQNLNAIGEEEIKSGHGKESQDTNFPIREGEIGQQPMKRPQSVTFSNQHMKLSTVALRRTSSLPDIHNCIELLKLDTERRDFKKSKEQNVYNVSLPAFPARFKPKKTKVMNPKRVGQDRQQNAKTPNSLKQENSKSNEDQESVMSDSFSAEPEKTSSPSSDSEEQRDEQELPDLKSVGNSPVIYIPSVDTAPHESHDNEQIKVKDSSENSVEKDETIEVPELKKFQENSFSIKDVSLEQPPVTMETDRERETTPATRTKPSSPEAQKIIATPAKTPAPVIEKLKKDKPKKTKKERVKDEPKPPPTPTPPLVERSITPDTPLPPLPNDGEMEVSQTTPTPEPTKEDLEPAYEIPPLPEIKDEKKETKIDDRRTTLIQPVPKLKEVKEPLPKKRPTPKPMKTMRSTPKRRARESAKAPVTPEELKQMQDPLDFLAKYCIINKDRLPYYERIYHNVVSNQTPKYERIHDSAATLTSSSSLPVLADHEMHMLHDLTVINRSQNPVRIGLSVPEQYLEKICYTIDILEQKQNKLSLDLHNLETDKIKKLAEKAKELIPHIIRPDFQVKAKKPSKKKKKKKGKGKEEKADSDEESPPEKLTASDITDRVIVDRLDDKMVNNLCKQQDVRQIDLETDRIIQKLSNLDDRIEQLENEKNLLGIYCMEYFFRDQTGNKKPTEFRRQQSSLYNKLHPDPDIEMNMEELEGALQVINHSLLTEREFEYLYNVLNLPGRLKINFQLFAVIAALSEKVTQLDPVIRKLLNKVDYGALDVKMDRSKELFELLDDGTVTPSGNAPAESLAVELQAGGLSQEHTNYVLSKFNRNGNGFIDFLDFVTYVPLFIEIHERIVKDPFNVQLFV